MPSQPDREWAEFERRWKRRLIYLLELVIGVTLGIGIAKCTMYVF